MADVLSRPWPQRLPKGLLRGESVGQWPARQVEIPWGGVSQPGVRLFQEIETIWEH